MAEGGFIRTERQGAESNEGASSLYLCQCRGRTGLFEGVGGLPKKAVSKSSKGEKLTSCQNYEIMEELRLQYSISRLLAIAGIKRASYDKWRTTQPQREARQDRNHEIRNTCWPFILCIQNSATLA